MQILRRLWSGWQSFLGRHQFTIRVLLCLVAAYVISILHYRVYERYGDNVEMVVLELWYNVRHVGRGGVAKAPSDVVVISLDEESYSELGVPFNRPWPRELHGKLLQRLALGGAKRVGFDVVFADPGATAEEDETLMQGFKAQPSVIGMLFYKPQGSDHRLPLRPYEPFREYAEEAIVSFPQQGDMLLHFKSERSAQSVHFSTLSEAVANKRVNLPTSRDFIWYYGPPRTIQTVPYYEVFELEEEDLVDFFENKYIFVGLSLETALGSAEKDTFLSPFWERKQLEGGTSIPIPFSRQRIFGVEVHATAAANLLTNTWVRQFPLEEVNFWLSLGVFFCALLINYFGPVTGLFILLIWLFLWSYTSFEMFQSPLHYFLPGVCAFFALLLNYLGCILLYYFSTYRDQVKTRDAFSMYLSPVMAREVSKDPSKRELRGDVIHATAMFTDIAGFTSITEKMSADKVAKMLNEYFTQVAGVVQENQGTLIKFIGDAIFAIWGAPIALEDHAERAIATALQLDEKVKEFNRRGDYPVLHTRIGVNTGQMLVGNLGTQTRMDYTAIGDSVNFAARLEGLNKYFGTTILISTSTAAEASKPYMFTRMGWVSVAGKSEAVPIYSIFEPVLESRLENLWREAQDEYRAKEWRRSEAIFVSIVGKDNRLDKAIFVYLDNIKRFKESPPLAGWQGSLIFSQK
jgi:adenylate cyclase